MPVIIYSCMKSKVKVLYSIAIGGWVRIIFNRVWNNYDIINLNLQFFPPKIPTLLFSKMAGTRWQKVGKFQLFTSSQHSRMLFGDGKNGKVFYNFYKFSNFFWPRLCVFDGRSGRIRKFMYQNFLLSVNLVYFSQYNINEVTLPEL